MNTSAVLRLQDLTFTYEGAPAPAIAGVESNLAAGQVVSVISGQGCGKTTLLRAIAGALGSIYAGTLLGSVVLESAPDGPRRSLTGDDVSSFFDNYVQVTLSAESVAEEIGLPLLALGIPEEERARMAARAAADLRIAHLLDRATTALSGGEEKLVGLAAAFCAPAAVLVLDEPFEQLDVGHLAAVIKAIKSRARRGGLVVVATAALDVALNIADAVLVYTGTRWETHASPSYQLLAESNIAPGASQVVAFLTEAAGARLADIHSFRDAVAWPSRA